MPEDNYEPEEHFNVVLFYHDGSYNYLKRWLGPEEALHLFRQAIISIGARLGIIEQVMITDGGDFCNMQWIRGKGIVFPPQESPVTERSRFTHVICDECWFAAPRREPYRVKDVVEERCCCCGKLTHSGIYFRAEPEDYPCEGRHESKNESQEK